MGILDGKRSWSPASSWTPRSASHVAKVAQEQGADVVLISNFGRALKITQTDRQAAARRRRPVLELDVTDEEHLDAPRRRGSREHVDGLDGVVHSIAFGNPETLPGGKFLNGPWDDVAQAVQVSAYSLKSLAVAALPLMGHGRQRRRADLRRDGRLAGLRLDGRRQGRARVDATATWPATSARRASAATWSRPAR